MDGTTSYVRQFTMAMNTWNGYHSGVIRGLYSTLFSDVDVTISDYEENSYVLGVTSYNTRTIKFNKTALERPSMFSQEDIILNTCIHELGHALGLDHRREPQSVMHATSQGVTTLNWMDKWNYDCAC